MIETFDNVTANGKLFCGVDCTPVEEKSWLNNGLNIQV